VSPLSGRAGGFIGRSERELELNGAAARRRIDYRQATSVADPMFMIYYATRNRAAVRTFTCIKVFLDE
jgi:hypothetical protein